MNLWKESLSNSPSSRSKTDVSHFWLLRVLRFTLHVMSGLAETSTSHSGRAATILPITSASGLVKRGEGLLSPQHPSAK